MKRCFPLKFPITSCERMIPEATTCPELVEGFFACPVCPPKPLLARQTGWRRWGLNSQTCLLAGRSDPTSNYEQTGEVVVILPKIRPEPEIEESVKIPNWQKWLKLYE